MSAVRLCLALSAMLATNPVAIAQDQVVLKRGSLSGKITIVGTIDDYTGEEIRIRTSQGDTIRTYPARDVISVVTLLTEPHDRGLAALRDNQVDEAIREFDTALTKERRAWVRREILSMLVQCALRHGDYPSVGTRFLALVKSDPTTRHFRLIPLAWSSEPVSPAARSEARAWLSESVEAGRLMGASLLLDDPELGTSASVVLRELATSTDRRIQLMAQAQGWRLEAARETIGELRVNHWQQRLDELPPELRSGPSFLLGRAYAARHDYELAAATFLWLPIVDDHDYRLSARACLEAGVALGRIGQQLEAQRLFREVMRRYSESPYADEARGLLEASAKNDSSPEKEVAP